MERKSKAILLIQCPPWDIGMPPLGIAYLSSSLKKQGYRTSLFDLNISLFRSCAADLQYLWEQKSYQYWVDDALFARTMEQLGDLTHKTVVDLIDRTDAGYIGISVNFASIKFANELIKTLKSLKPELTIILGGWGCINEHMRSLFPKELVDVFVVGEGEATLQDTIEALEGRRGLDNIPGAIFNRGRDPGYSPRTPVMDLDALPWPTFSEFNLDRYTTRALPLFTSRGCISACSFCNDWRLAKPYRFRSAQNVFEEIKYHVENNRISTFSFKDLLCNGNIDRLKRLSGLIIDSGIKVSWDSQAIPLKEMASGLLSKLKQSGCEALIYGIESFSNHVLKGMKKLFTQEIAERVLRDTRDAGINTAINLIVGFPGETEDDFQETLEAIERNQKYISSIGAISTCLINNDCDLEAHHREYGLVLPLDAKVRAKEWVSADGENTYGIRRRRAEKVIALVDRLGLSYVTATI